MLVYHSLRLEVRNIHLIDEMNAFKMPIMLYNNRVEDKT